MIAPNGTNLLTCAEALRILVREQPRSSLRDTIEHAAELLTSAAEYVRVFDSAPKEQPVQSVTLPSPLLRELLGLLVDGVKDCARYSQTLERLEAACRLDASRTPPGGLVDPELVRWRRCGIRILTLVHGKALDNDGRAWVDKVESLLNLGHLCATRL